MGQIHTEAQARQTLNERQRKESGRRGGCTLTERNIGMQCIGERPKDCRNPPADRNADR